AGKSWLQARPKWLNRLWEAVFGWLHQFAARHLKRIPPLYYLLSLLFSLAKTYPRILSPYMWRQYLGNLRECLRFIRKGFIEVSEPLVSAVTVNGENDSEHKEHLRARVYAFGDITFFAPHENIEVAEGTFDRLTKRIEYALFSPFLLINHLLTLLLVWRQSDAIWDSAVSLYQQLNQLF
ncbi:MAG: hypothetical protein AAFQ98_15905, partial [Bacteroidota bacterium]